MKLFISWSGQKSRLVATALHSWLPDVVNAVEPFMSESDIEKGAVGLEVIAEQLEASSFGIVCVTRTNMDRPWLNYEAGALSKFVGDQSSRVATLLVDVESPSEVQGPMGRFQATKLGDLADFQSLIRTIARHAEDSRPDDRLNQLVTKLYPNLTEMLKAGKLDSLDDGEPVNARSGDEKVDEILEIVRQLATRESAVSSPAVQSTPAQWWTAQGRDQHSPLNRALTTKLHQALPRLGLHLTDITAEMAEGDLILTVHDKLDDATVAAVVSELRSLTGVPRRLIINRD